MVALWGRVRDGRCAIVKDVAQVDPTCRHMAGRLPERPRSEGVRFVPDSPLVEGVDTIKIGANNMEYVFFPGRAHLKAGTTVTFTNAGDTPHSATSFESGKVGTWDTGILNSGESKTITFDKPGNYFYICTPNPWMYGQVIVE
jgi:plastocyanin